jgi:hypothetical protein
VSEDKLFDEKVRRAKLMTMAELMLVMDQLASALVMARPTLKHKNHSPGGYSNECSLCAANEAMKEWGRI